MNPVWYPVGLAGLLFLGMAAALEVGYRLGRRRLLRDPEAAAPSGTIEASVYALLGLILAFTSAGASSRLAARRQLVVDEANAIGTAYLRLDLLPEARQGPLRDAFRRYVEARLRPYEHLHDLTTYRQDVAVAAGIQNEIWSLAVAACKAEPNDRAALLLLPALNAMIDVTTSRAVAIQTHVPAVMLVLLVALAVVGAGLTGYAGAAGKRRRVVPALVLATLIAFTFYVILDLEFPRTGMIRIGAADDAMQALREQVR